ncbi:MAG: RDD family protein [Actinomycetota bacterium]
MSTPPPPPPPPGSVPPPPGYQAYQPAYQAPPQYAGVGSRFGGMLVDGLISIVFSAPGIAYFFAGPSEIRACTVNGEEGFCDLPTNATFAIAGILWAVGAIAFLVLYCKKVGATGQSWGAKAVGNKIVDVNTGQPIGTGRAFGRTLFRSFVSGSVCFLGFLWALWDPKKQTWHDKVVSSIVVKA